MSVSNVNGAASKQAQTGEKPKKNVLQKALGVIKSKDKSPSSALASRASAPAAAVSKDVSSVRDAVLATQQQVHERGERIADLQSQTGSLAANAAKFAELTRQLNQKRHPAPAASPVANKGPVASQPAAAPAPAAANTGRGESVSSIVKKAASLERDVQLFVPTLTLYETQMSQYNVEKLTVILASLNESIIQLEFEVDMVENGPKVLSDALAQKTILEKLITEKKAN